MRYPIRLIPGHYSIYSTNKKEFSWDRFLTEEGFSFVTTEGDRLSVVTKKDSLSSFHNHCDNWSLFCLQGPIPFEEAGILEKVLKLLSDMRISVLVYSSYDSDYILVRETQLNDALKALNSLMG